MDNYNWETLARWLFFFREIDAKLLIWKETTNNESNKPEPDQETEKSNIDNIALQEIKDAIKDEFKKNSTDSNMTKPKISFNDTDSVLDMGTNISNDVLAPKNIERLEEISRVNKEKERDEYDADDDDFEDDGPLNILDDTINLNDIEDLSKPKLELDEIVLDDIEVLA